MTSDVYRKCSDFLENIKLEHSLQIEIGMDNNFKEESVEIIANSLKLFKNLKELSFTIDSNNQT